MSTMKSNQAYGIIQQDKTKQSSLPEEVYDLTVTESKVPEDKTKKRQVEESELLSENIYESADSQEPEVLVATIKKREVEKKPKDGKCKECVIVFTAVLALFIAIVAILIAVILSTSQAYSKSRERQPIPNEDIVTLKQKISQLRETLNQTEMKFISEVEMNKNHCRELIVNLQNTSQTQHGEEVKFLREQIQTLLPGGSNNPVTSCKDIPTDSPSGQYWIQNSITLPPVQAYCDMEQRSCSCTLYNSTGGWMRVANLDMTNSSQHCPDGFRLVNRPTAPLRTCGNPGQAGCVSTTFPVHGIEYSRVCGRVISYQVGTTDAFYPYYAGQNTIDGYYIDGVSLTHGQPPREHIWTFAAAIREGYNTPDDRFVCPCNNGGGTYTGTVPPFISDDYFCDSALRQDQPWTHGELYPDDPLWDGQGCGDTSACCEFNNPPWFCKQLPQSTTDDIELRLCGDRFLNQLDDTPFERVEIYIN